MVVGLLVLHLRFPGCDSLKEKRRRLRGRLERLGRVPSLSVREIADHDLWGDGAVAVATVAAHDSEVGVALERAQRQFEDVAGIEVFHASIESWSTG